jgi:hypothetical protein
MVYCPFTGMEFIETPMLNPMADGHTQTSELFHSLSFLQLIFEPLMSKIVVPETIWTL